MKILLTGAAGFLGSSCLENFPTEFDCITTDKTGSVDYLGDLSDASFVESLPNVNCVVHCAAVQYVSKDLPWFGRKQYFEKNNVIATKLLGERYNNGSTHFVNIGTSMMYQQTGAKIYTETSHMGGEGVYSVSKFKAQSYISKIKDSATIIPCIIGGPGREGLFRGFVNSIEKFGRVAFPGKGKNKIHMVHVEDVASLISLVIKQRLSGFFNAAAPKPLCIHEWVDQIGVELKKNKIRRFELPLSIISFMAKMSDWKLLAREQIMMLGMDHVLSIEKSTAIGWSPQRTNEDIVRDIAKYIISNK